LAGGGFRVNFALRQSVGADGRALARIACRGNGVERCRGKLTLTLGRPVARCGGTRRYAARFFQPAGAALTTRIHLGAAALKCLARPNPPGFMVAVVAHDAANAPFERTRRIKLRLP
jgi:hypothetical protein